MPTALERAGDFSQTTDNNGALYPYIKDPLLTGACTAASQTAASPTAVWSAASRRAASISRA